MTSASPTVPVNVGDVLLGKYVVERVIGAGGMGVVVAVRHRDLGELYAMKFMLPAALANDQAVERFVREARAAAKLKSEHVAKVHDVGRLENGSPYMVMEYLTGSDLEGVLAQHGPLPVTTAAMYVMQACDAIAEAHEAGIVHRDLKPANLFLTKRANGSPCIKVLDFGISKSVNPDEAANSMTRTTAIMGSPYYMSPEQMRSSKNVDHRTDVWALGVILYQLSTGRVPFPGETITEVCSGVLADEPAALTTLLQGIPQEFDGVVRRCLQKQPNYRFGSARELAAALAAVTGPQAVGTTGLNLPAPPVPARPATVAMDGPPPAMRASRPDMASSASGHNAAAAIGSTTGNEPGQTQAQWGSTQPTPKKKSAAVPILIGVLALGGLAVAGFVFMNKSQPASAGASTQKPAATSTSESTSQATTASAKTAEATSTATTAATASAPPSASASAVETVAIDTASAKTSAEPEGSTKVASGGGGGGRPKAGGGGGSAPKGKPPTATTLTPPPPAGTQPPSIY